MVVSFFQQKGGAQKTTLTTLFASSIHFGIRKLHVAVIDADLQESLYDSRQADLELVKNDPRKLKKLQELLKKADKEYIYEIYKASILSKEVVPKIKELRLNYDIILIDLPGTLEIPNLGEIVAELDYVIVPVYVDDKSINATKKHLHKLKLIQESGKSKIKEVSIVFTRYVTNERSMVHQQFEKYRSYFREQGYHVFENALIDSKSFDNIVDDAEWPVHEGDQDEPSLEKKFVSTTFPFPTTRKYEKISPWPLVKEIAQHLVSKNEIV